MNTLAAAPEHRPEPYLTVEQHKTLEDQVKAWQNSDEERPTVYDMPEPVTDALKAANIYTTSAGVTEADNPVTRIEYLRRENYKADLKTIANNVTRAFQGKPGFEAAAKTNDFGHNTLGSKLAETLGAVTAITAHNVHVDRPRMRKGKMVSGKTVAERVTLTVPSLEKSKELLVALQTLLVTKKGACTVLPAFGEDGSTIIGVEVYGLNEHMVRSMGRGVGELVAQEDRRKYGTVLPHRKRSLVQWKKGDEEHGEKPETFHPKVEGRLEAADQAYKALTLQASYGSDGAMLPVTTNKDPDYHLLGTDAAAMLQGLRDIFNIEIARTGLRGGTHGNPEQDPDKDARLLIDAGTELRRPKATPEATKYGPLTARRITSRQQGQEKAQGFAKRAQSNLTEVIAEVGDLVTDIGPSKLAFTALKHVILARRGLKKWGEVRDRLYERDRLQDPDLFVRRLSWLVNMGPEPQLLTKSK